MTQTPISAYQEIKGIRYFARMLDKIRKQAAGKLREDFHENLGVGLDGYLCDYLRVDYSALTEETLKGDSDESILEWCFANGRTLNEGDILIWNHFLNKLGWNDHVSEMLAQRKAENGLTDRDDIASMAEYFEYDEGRK